MTDVIDQNRVASSHSLRRAGGLSRGVTATALALCWVPFALAETLLGDLDALDDVSAVAAGSARITAAGLLHLLAGVLLAIGVAGVLPHLRTRVGRALGVVVLAVAVSVGGFGQFHLLALEAARDGLDAAAMQDYLMGFSESAGAWAVPVAVVALLGLPAIAGMCLSLARCGGTGWTGPIIVLCAAVLHAAPVGDGMTEALSHWAVAVGLAVVAADLVRRQRQTAG